MFAEGQKGRTILHCDMNNFYATVECLYNPGLRDKPVAVCGDATQRRGIVLAKNYIAKGCGIRTGDSILEAKQKCPGLEVLTANFPLYMEFSKRAREIYQRYTDKTESFGIDECWLDVSGSLRLFKSGEHIASEIRRAIKEELGCTVSVGVSFNKVFAKLGSDMKKPDATTVINLENYKSTVYPLPASDLLYVGRQTAKKLKKYNINTIGDIANSKLEFLTERLGKWGMYLWSYANGLDNSPVIARSEEHAIKSVSNSSTAPRDLIDRNAVLMMASLMSESVARRLREQGLKGSVVSLQVRDCDLHWFGKQIKIKTPTYISNEIIKTAMYLFDNFYDFKKPVRSVGVTVSDLCPAGMPYQFNFFDNDGKRQKLEKLEKTIDILKKRFGRAAIKRCLLLSDFSSLDPAAEDALNQYSFFKN